MRERRARGSWGVTLLLRATVRFGLAAGFFRSARNRRWGRDYSEFIARARAVDAYVIADQSSTTEEEFGCDGSLREDDGSFSAGAGRRFATMYSAALDP